MFYGHGRFGCNPPGAGRGGWGFDPDVSGWFWGGGRRRGGPFRGGRVFEQGDLRYVILQLLEEKPRHGYEVIKALEERFGGVYTPSAGTVYPTLTMLEDMGYATASVEQGGKKVYSITDEGRAYLAQNRSAVDDIFDRIADIGGAFLSEAMMEVNRAFKEVGRATYTSAPRLVRDRAFLERLRDILRRAASEIDDAARAARSGQGGGTSGGASGGGATGAGGGTTG